MHDHPHSQGTRRIGRPGPGATPVRIALIGCGTIAELYHLPALAHSRLAANELVLVDRDPARLEAMASKFPVGGRCRDHRDVLGEVQGAIVATPPELHHPLSMDLIEAGIHVFCEKPLAATAEEAEELVAAAARRNVTLAVNHTRRLFPANQRIRTLIDDGSLGTLESIAVEEGQIFSWEAASGFHFKRDSTRGVLFDKGIHTLDTICWWLGAQPQLVSSRTDSFGGVEGVAEVRLRHRECVGRVRVSWLSRLANRYSVVGSLGAIEGGLEDWDRVVIKYTTGTQKRLKLRVPESSYNDFGRRMIDNFLDVVEGRSAPLVSGADVLPSMHLIDDCYRRAEPFDMPWYDTLERDNATTTDARHGSGRLHRRPTG